MKNVKTKKVIHRRPKLRACLAYWDKDKGYYKMTAPKSAKTAKGMECDALFLLTDTLEKRFLQDILSLQQSMKNSEIGATFYARGRVSYEDLMALEAPAT
jgi:hypothetical protein